MFSRFSHVVSCASSSLLFIAKYSIICLCHTLFILSLLDGPLHFFLHFLVIMNNVTNSIHFFLCVCVNMFSFLLDVYLVVKSIVTIWPIAGSYGNYTFKLLKKTARWLEGLHSFIVPLVVYEDCFFSMSSPTLVIIYIFFLVWLNWFTERWRERNRERETSMGKRNIDWLPPADSLLEIKLITQHVPWPGILWPLGSWVNDQPLSNTS